MVREWVPLAYHEVQLLREGSRNNVTREGTLGCLRVPAGHFADAAHPRHAALTDPGNTLRTQQVFVWWYKNFHR